MRKQIAALTLPAALFAALFAALLWSTPALAQSDYCSTLDDESCALFYASGDVMRTVTSQTDRTEVDLAILNVPEIPYSDLMMNVIVESDIAFNDGAADLVQQLQVMTVDEIAELLLLGDSFADLLIEAIGDIAYDFQLDVAFSDDVVAAMEEVGGEPWPSAVNLGLRFVDNVLYIDMSQLADVVPEASMFGDGWMGVELGETIEEALSEAFADIDYDSLQAELNQPGVVGTPLSLSATTPLSLNSLPAGPLVTRYAPLDPDAIGLQFLSVERLDDSVVDGADVAVFRTALDYETLLDSELFEDIVRFGLESDAGPGEEIDEREVSQIVSSVRLFSPILLDGLEFELVESVGLDDSYLYRSDFVLSLDLTNIAGAVAAFEGDPSAMEGFDPDAPTVFTLDVSVNSSDFNADLGIEAPERAPTFTPEELDSMSFDDIL